MLKASKVRHCPLGTVEKTQSQQHGCGGFIGDVSGCQVEVTFRNCTNSGTIQGIHVIGGFIGMIENNSNSTITFELTSNQGTIRTGKGVGGFIGASQINTNSSISFLSCKNTGSITGDDYVGGFAGAFASNSNMTVYANKSHNSGNINGTVFGGGFIGSIDSSEQKHSISIFITDSVNSGSIETIACGFFCVNTSTHVYSSIQNCMNNGTLKGNFTFGISPQVTYVHNFVNKGEMYGKNDSYCFFFEAQSNSSLYTSGNCNNNLNNDIYQNENNTLYYTSNNQQVDVILNKEASDNNYGFRWTSTLDVVERHVSITFGSPIDATINMEYGGTLNMAFESLALSCEKNITVDRTTWEPLKCFQVLEGNTNAALCHNVTVLGVFNMSKNIEHGSALGDCPNLTPFLTKQYLLSAIHNKSIKYNETTQVLDNMIISITKLSTIEIVIISDDSTEWDEDSIKKAIIEIIDSSDNDYTDISIVDTDDGYTVSVTVPEERSNEIKERFDQCVNEN